MSHHGALALPDRAMLSSTILSLRGVVTTPSVLPR